MAIINRDDFFSSLASGTKWSAGVAFTRTNPLPIDDKSVFATLEEAQTYAKSATAYPGQVIAVVTTTETTFYGINQAGELQDLGGSSAPMLFVDDQSEMLALQDIEIGQQVYREDTHTVWIFKGGTISEINNWVESASQNDTVWTGTESRVVFYALTQSTYDGIGSKDSNTLYFLTDTGKIYKGDINLTDSVLPISDFPEVASAIRNKLYIHTTSFECRITNDNAKWITVTPGYLTDGGNWAEADGNKLATIAFIKKGINEAITNISLTTSFDKGSGTVTVGSGTGAVLTGVAHDPQYDAGQLRLTIPVYGGSNIVVDIPKDKFVTAGQYYADYPDSDSATHHNVIVLTIDNQAEPVIIPAEALVNVYTANNTGKDIAITVTDDNKISAQAVIDPAEGNALVTSATGLLVDVSDKMDTIADATGTKIALTTAEGGVSESTYTILASGDMGNSNTVVPTANLIAAAISAAVNTGIGNAVQKVIGVENNLVGFAAEGAIKDSGVKAGTATLNEAPDATTLATEAAVAAAIEDSELTWNVLS